MEKRDENKLCPLIEKCYEECYCVKMTSQSILMALKYCSGGFRECEIYRKICPEKNLSNKKITV